MQIYKYLYVCGLCLCRLVGRLGRGEVGTLKKIASSARLVVFVPQIVGT